MQAISITPAYSAQILRINLALTQPYAPCSHCLRVDYVLSPLCVTLSNVERPFTFLTQQHVTMQQCSGAHENVR